MSTEDTTNEHGNTNSDGTNGNCGAPAGNDAEGLMSAFLDKACDARDDLVAAHTVGDEKAQREAIMRMRAACLMIASIPASDPALMPYPVLAGALLMQHDDVESSHARRMIALAIEINDPD